MRRLRARRVGLVLWSGVCAGALVAGPGFAQRGSGSGSSSTSSTPLQMPSTPTSSSRSMDPSYGTEFPFDGARRQEMEEKRTRLMMSERQRLMAKEASQILQDAAELQASLGAGDPSREELFKRADAIEKLAKNVKERMKGAR